MQGLYEVLIVQASDRFEGASLLHAAFVAEMNLSFDRPDNGGREEDELTQITERMEAWYESMLLLAIARSEKASPRLEAQ